MKRLPKQTQIFLKYRTFSKCLKNWWCYEYCAAFCFALLLLMILIFCVAHFDGTFFLTPRFILLLHAACQYSTRTQHFSSKMFFVLFSAFRECCAVLHQERRCECADAPRRSRRRTRAAACKAHLVLPVAIFNCLFQLFTINEEKIIICLISTCTMC